MNNHTSIVRYSIGALSFAMAGCETVVPCDAEVGVCPRPEVGVVVNDAGVIKSIWLEEPEYTVTGNGVLKTICRGDLDLTPGEEVLFRGAQGFVVMEEKFQSPQVLSRVPINPLDILFVDVEADGDVEYIEREFFGNVSLRRHSGDIRWEVRSDYDKAPPFWQSSVLWFDIDGNGSLEFLVSTDHGVEVRAAHGETLATLGNLPYWTMYLGQFDDDADLELVTLDYDFPSPPPDRFHRLSTFDLDGTLIGSFSSPDRDTDWLFESFYIAPDPTTPTLERILVDCKLYDPSGQAVGVLEEGEYGYCYSQRDIIGRDSVYDGCPTNEGLTAEPIDVRFAQETEAYRVEVTYSLERVDWMHSLQEGTYYNPKRTILKVFDPNGTLVYHEVLGSKSGPGSFTVIPSDVEGAEVLLVADDSTVFAYTLPANAP